MALSLPSVRMRVRSARRLLAGASTIHVVAGVCSKGPFTPTRVADIDSLVATFGTGPAVKSLAYSMAKTGAAGVMSRILPTAVAASTTAPDVTSWTGANPPVISGTPNDSYSVAFEIVTGTVLGTATYRYSTDGTTYTAPATTPGGGAIVLTGTGITVTLSGAVAGSFTFSGVPASQSVSPVTSTRIGASTSVVTVTGTTLEACEGRLEILTGGTRGTAGITYCVSLDGGRSRSREFRLGTDVTIQINDGTLDSGLDWAIGAGTLEAGDVFTFTTTEAVVQAADVVTAIDALDDSSVEWNFVHVVGPLAQGAVATIGAEFTTFAADALGNSRFTFGVFSARSKHKRETETTWENALVDDFVGLENARCVVGAGYTRMTCPITKRRNRRPVSWAAVPEIISRPIAEEIARKASGSLTTDVQLYENGERIEHDARRSPTLQGARFLTARTYRGSDNVFITRGSTFDVEGGLEGNIPRRRVLDRASEIFRRVLEDKLEDGIDVNAADEPNPGAPAEEECARIDRDVTTAIEAELAGSYSALSVQTSRTTVLAAGVRLPCKVSITGLDYIDGLDGEIGYVAPELEALAAAA